MGADHHHNPMQIPFCGGYLRIAKEILLISIAFKLRSMGTQIDTSDMCPTQTEETAFHSDIYLLLSDALYFPSEACERTS
jgi:hypothetical protein